MTSQYFNQLDQASKDRYLTKLTFNGTMLPDPLDEDIRSYIFISNSMKMWPSVAFGDIYMYLVEQECSYTKEKFKNYKSLDSYNYLLSGKVNNVLLYRNEGVKVCVLTCDVQGSQTAKKVHKPWAIVTTDGIISSGHCTCMAGLGEVCSYVAALLFALEVATREGIETPAPTSLACLWNKPSKKVTSMRAVDIQFSHKQKRKTPKRSYGSNQMPSEDAYNTFVGIIKKYQPSASYLTVLSDDEDTSTSSETEEVEKENDRIMPNISSSLLQLNEKLPVNLSVDQRVKILIEQYKVSTEQIKLIEQNTRGQSTSMNWIKQREGRLTASLFGRTLRCARGAENLAEAIIGFKTNILNESLKWGQKNEKLAKLKFDNYIKNCHVNAQLLPTGFLIDKQYPFLGATPDGMLECDCCEPALIEIKCPARGKGLLISEISQKNFFLDENLTLKVNHSYYDQIQGQMDIWNIYKCYFVTFTDMDMHIQVIDYNPEYWGMQKPKLIRFFKDNVLPKMLHKF